MSKQLITAVNAISKIRRYYRKLSPVNMLDAFLQGIISDIEYNAIKSQENHSYIQAITA